MTSTLKTIAVRYGKHLTEGKGNVYHELDDSVFTEVNTFQVAL